VSTSLQLREQMAAILTTEMLFAAFPVQVLPRRMGNPTPPSIDMWPGNGGEMRDYASAGFQTVGGALLFTVRARVAAADSEAQQELLYSFCDDDDPLCVAAALMDDQTLGGYAASVDVRGPSEPTIYQDVIGDPPLLGAQWRVLVEDAET
jgi:hypothetical protein